MIQEKEFYPLVSHTIKVLIDVGYKERFQDYLLILRNYPNVNPDDYLYDSICAQIVHELDRQYARWTKGGKNGKDL